MSTQRDAASSAAIRARLQERAAARAAAGGGESSPGSHSESGSPAGSTRATAGAARAGAGIAMGTRRVGATGAAPTPTTAAAHAPASGSPGTSAAAATSAAGARLAARAGAAGAAGARLARPEQAAGGAAAGGAAADAPGSRLAARRATGQTGGANPYTRRPSRVVVEREKKTEYWRDVQQVAEKDGSKISGEDFNNVISRAMTLGIVGDKKQRESLSGPKAHDLLVNMKDEMEKRLVEISGGKINVDALQAQNASLMDKILGLEKTLSALERKKTQQEEEEKAKVQSKITELETSLRQLESQKRDQREQNRRTMKLEIANLKEMMSKVQKEQAGEQAAAQETKAMAQKMARLEAALRLMNEERKKGAGVKADDKDALLLKKKLALFEQKLKDMEEEKRMRSTEEDGNALRDKLLLMEDKLEKMERRKSMSMTMMLQQKMDGVEKQLGLLRTKAGGADAANVQAKMAELEKQLQEMAKSKAAINPSMVNDEETVALRSHVAKLESSVLAAERRMEEQRKKIEEERLQAFERRKEEEEKFRKQQQLREAELLKRIQMMENRIKEGGGGGGGGSDPQLLERLKKLESGGVDAVSAKMTDLEKKLMETQAKLEDERKLTQDIIALAPKEPSALEGWQKDAQIAWLQEMNKQLMEKINSSTMLIDLKIAEMQKMSISGGGGAVVHKSGLTYEDINKKLAEIQAKLFDENTDERESEQLNIEYEKLITELEQTPEYKKEQEAAKEKWRLENEGPNRDAFHQVKADLEAKNETQQQQVFSRKPELKLLLRTPEQLLKAHINDFKTLSTQNLDEDEARALYHNMPKFRPEQDKQCEWVEQLRQKIETEKGKPKKKPPPPIPPTKKIVIKKADPVDDDGGGGGFLEELLKKRKRRD